MVDPASAGIAYTVVLGVIVLAILLLVFMFKLKQNPDFMLYRKFLVDRRVIYPELENENGTFLTYMKPLPSPGLFGWFTSSSKASVESIKQLISYDAAMCVAAWRNKTIVFAVLGSLCCLVLMPVYGTYKDASGSHLVEGIGVVSVANLPQGSKRAWATFVMDIVVVVGFLFYIYKELQMYLQRRSEFRSELRAANYAVAVQDLPADIQDEDSIRMAFEAAYPGEVEGVVKVFDSSAVEKLMGKYGKALNSRESAEHKFLNDKKGRRPQKGTTWWKCCLSPKVDAIEHWRGEQDRLGGEIRQAQTSMDPTMIKPTKSAIVVFRSRHAASQAQKYKAIKGTKVTRIGGPDEVHWPGLRKSKVVGIIWALLIYVWMVVILLFWAVVVTAVMSLANLSQLASRLSFLKPLLQLSAFLTSFIQGFLPALVLIILNMLPTLVISILVARRRHPSTEKVANNTRTLVFVYGVFSTFLFVVIGGTALQQLDTIMSDPGSVAPLMAQGVPKQSTFFLNFILQSSFFGAAIALSQIVRIIVVPILGILFKTPRGQKKKYAFGTKYGYAGAYSSSAIIGIIAVVYSTLSPAVFVFAVVYFGLNLIVARFQVSYAKYDGPDQGGSMFWTHMHINFVALYVKVVVTMVAFGLLQSWWVFGFTALELVAIIVVHIYFSLQTSKGWHGTAYSEEPVSQELDVNPTYVASYRERGLTTLDTIPDFAESSVFKPSRKGEEKMMAKAAGVEDEDEQFYDKGRDKQIEAKTI